MKLVRSISKSLPWVFALVATVSVAGCAEPTVEPKGATTAKLLAPRAVFRAKASPVSKQAYGITEWRMYRGKRDVIVTGYDARGRAVKGLTVGFHTTKSGGSKKGAVLRARVLDGSLFAARHVYGGASSSNKQISVATDAFLRTALRDLQAVRSSLTSEPKTLGQSTTGGACGADMMQILMQAIQCVMAAGKDPNALTQCLLAAQSAANAGGACQPIPGDPNGGDPYDPNGGGPYDPNGQGQIPGDPGQYPGDQGGYPGDPGQYPGDQGGYPGDPGQYPGDMSDPYGDQGMCPSCGQGGDDIYSDPYNGGVDFEDGGFEGDFGEGY